MNDSLRSVGGKLLRRGYTTGSCAAAASLAATRMLLTQEEVKTVTLATPKGTMLTLDILNAQILSDYASCAVQKDSGDDPDITNGCLVYARVSRIPDGIRISGGEGIGRVTKPGLDQPVGEYAINTTPRRMIREVCESVCAELNCSHGLAVVISIPGGAELAAKTFNPRLGIDGGLSVLGTTGIVEPMSEAAIVETIRAELSMLYAAGHRDVLLTIGNYGEAFARDFLKLSFVSHVKCSNFIGETLDAAAEKGFERALLVGHIGKLAKLGIGITNTHSRYGDGRMETLAACALKAGAGLNTLREILNAATTDAALEIITNAGVYKKTKELLCLRVTDTLARRVPSHLQTGFCCYKGMNEKAELCFQSGAAEKLREVFAI